MRFFNGLILVLFAQSTFTALSWASDHGTCLATPFTEAHSLAELPDQVRQILHKDRYGLDELVDHGAEFSNTDVGSAPRRRFALAAVSANHILIAVEHGGRGYSVELWEFLKRLDGWHGEQRNSLFSVPRSSQELILDACN